MRITWKQVVATLASTMLLGCTNPSPANGGGGTTGGGTTTSSSSTGASDPPPALGSPTPSLGSPTPDATGTPVASSDKPAIEHGLLPLPGKENAVPKITEKKTVIMTTSEGKITIEVYPEAAPNAAERFIELVESGFYNDTPISRVVDGFVAQFGINWREPHKEWKEKNFDDDPSLFALEPGTLAFAKAGPNTNSTQVFINLRENNRLSQMTFTTFARVVDGMDVVRKFKQVGDKDGGLEQARLWADGDSYLESLDEKPSMIETVVVKED